MNGQPNKIKLWRVNARDSKEFMNNHQQSSDSEIMRGQMKIFLAMAMSCDEKFEESIRRHSTLKHIKIGVVAVIYKLPNF